MEQYICAIRRDDMENRIAALRKERRISQAELAEAVAVTRQTIISLESGRYNASLLLAHKSPNTLKPPSRISFCLRSKNHEAQL